MSNVGGVGQSSFNFDGVASGLNTSQIIDQLLAIESRPKLLAERRQKVFQDRVSAFNNLSGRLSSLRTAAQELTSSTGFLAAKATSSDPQTATVTAGTARTAGTVTFSVDRLAQSHVLRSSGTVGALTDVVAPGGSVTINGRVISVGGGTLREVVNAVNGDAQAAATASAVKVAEGQYRLQFTARQSGASGALNLDDPTQLSGVGGAFLEAMAAQDAKITVGTGAGAYEVESATNTIDGVLEGVSISLLKTSAPGTTVTVTTSADRDAVADRVGKLVEALNGFLGEVKKLTAYDRENQRASVLTGNGAVRQVRDAVIRAVTDAVGSGTAAAAGVAVDREGVVRFDRTRFLEQLAADPEGTAAVFQRRTVDGVADRVVAAVNDAISPTRGILTTARNGSQSSADGLKDVIERYEDRIDRRRSALRRQFSSLETALSGLQGQAQWLAGALRGVV